MTFLRINSIKDCQQRHGDKIYCLWLLNDAKDTLKCLRTLQFN